MYILINFWETAVLKLLVIFASRSIHSGFVRVAKEHVEQLDLFVEVAFH